MDKLFNGNQIPKHWQETTLGKIISISSGNGLSKSNRNDDGEFLVYGGNGITGKHCEFLFEEEKLIIGRVGVHCGNAYITKPKSWVTDNAFVVSFDEKKIGKRFLLEMIKYLNLNKYSSSTAQPVISQGKIYPINISLPPLSEQQLIVSKIEELLSDLENGKQQLQTAQQQLKIYRQSLLKWAFEGKLTNKNVKDRELPKGWKIVELKDVALKITDGEHFRPQTQKCGIPFLSAKDVKNEGVSFDEPLYISEETAKKAIQRCDPRRGDILIVSRGATVGRMCIVNTDKQFCLLGSVILIKVNKTINSKLLNYILKSPIANQKMINVSGATAQQAIYLRDIKNISIPLPSLEEQQLIIEELESKLTVCDKIEETISQSLLKAETYCKNRNMLQ